MAFTREFIRKTAKESGVEIPKEFEDALVNEHIAARDAFKDDEVRKALEANRPEPAIPVKETQEYKDLKREFDNLKKTQAEKEALRAKEKAYRAALKEVNISEKRMDTVVKAAHADGIIDGLELDEKGGIKDANKLKESIKTDWADFIVTTTTQGANVPHPPATVSGNAESKANPKAALIAAAYHNNLYGEIKKE